MVKKKNLMVVGDWSGGVTSNGESYIAKKRKSEHMETMCRMGNEARRKSPYPRELSLVNARYLLMLGRHS